jgi:flagellar basal-body rod modification protein FlgD
MISATNIEATNLRPPQTSKEKATVDYDSFLRLLVAQMRNQDPTSPTDSSEYFSQLASFSNVEQGLRMNDRLDALLAQGSMNQAGSLIGKTYTDDTQSGRIEAVMIYSDGVDIRLDNGAILRPGPGSTISL